MDSSQLAHSFTTPLPSITERYEAGKKLREKAPLSDHAIFTRNAATVNPIDILLKQASTRVPELIPVRHARMLTSPFAFLRGSAAVMAADLAGSPSSGLQVQACGDMHVANFGVFASAERNLVFGINDFDETLPGSWEWDVKRLAASAAVAARFLLGKKVQQKEAAWAVTESYRKHIREYRKSGFLATWYTTIEAEDILQAFPKETRKKVQAFLAKSRKRGHLQVLDKMTELVNDQHRIVEDSPFIIHMDTTYMGRPINEGLGMLLEAYLGSLGYDKQELLSRYRVVDVAFKVVGVGSVGTRCWVILLKGADDEDPLFLQVKEAQDSVLQAYFTPQTPFANNGNRIVAGQRLIQGSPDIFLGSGTMDNKDFYVRQLRDMKGSVDLNPGVTKLSDFNAYCRLCGRALALAHAKSGDAAMISGYIGKSDEMIDAFSEFAMQYADQTDRDFDAMKKAAKKGLIEVAAVEN